MKFKSLLTEGRHNKKLLHRYSGDTPVCVEDIIKKGVAFYAPRYHTWDDGFFHEDFYNLGDCLDAYGELDTSSKMYKNLVVDSGEFKKLWLEIGKKASNVAFALGLPNANLLPNILNAYGALEEYLTFMRQKARWNDDEEPVDKFYMIMERLFTLIPRTLRDLDRGIINCNVQKIIFPALKDILNDLETLEGDLN